MDVVGSEIGQKMRSAIKAKLTELGCYVDDELPDYVMVMVANKRTRAQMEEDLQLFLGDNTELFVNWLHQVLKKLQEVTVPPLQPEPEKTKEKTKEKKPKEKKDKDKVKLKKIDTVKKAKKKEKAKEKLRKKEEKKSHKSKKKSKHHEMIRPNIPPLLMNIEKESEPSITDVFAGQILKNHGIILDMPKEDKAVDTKPVLPEPKRPILPIIDPATISSQPEPEPNTQDNRPNVTMGAPREEQIKEINEIEAKIQGLKQKLAEQLDSMSDDEDFLNIRTEAEELMNDFAEDVFQEISSQAPPVAPSVETPPIRLKSPSPPPSPKISVPEKVPEETPIEVIVETPKEPELPQIELKLPKRPIRERLGIRDEPKKLLEESQKKFPEGPIKLVPETSKAGKDKQDKRTESPERYTPDRDPFWGKLRPAKSRLRDHPDTSSKKRSKSDSDESEKSDEGFRKGSSNPKRGGCVSVVCVRPRPRAPAPASALLLRAVADAHKSLLNIPPKMDAEQQKVKRALVLPIRRSMEQKIVIQVPGDRQSDSEIRLDLDSDEEKLLKMDSDKEEYIPTSITKKITNTDYVPSRRPERTTSRRDDTLIVETINIHNTTVDKDKDTQFIVTMDGFNPNAFLAKKLKTEGLLDDESEVLPKEAKTTPITTKSVLKTHETEKPIETKTAEKSIETKTPEKKDERPESVKKSDTVIEAIEKKVIEEENIVEPPTTPSQKKRLSDTSDDSDIHVIIKADGAEKVDKRKSDEIPRNKIVEECATAKKRKASPIVFDVAKKEKEGEIKRERTKSESSDNHVVVTTNSSHKYDSLPSRTYPRRRAVHFRYLIYQEIVKEDERTDRSLPTQDDAEAKLLDLSVPSERKQVWCRSFPSCRWGAMCAFAHPRCKFAAACTRRGCVYQHDRPPATPVPVPVPHAVVPSTAPIIASHVVPAANYKSISGAIPSVCKYYPNCVNPACHYYHPKPCRYGKACANKLECNFYHTDVPSKWRYPV